METVGSEIPGTKAMELTEALWAQMAMMQGQACIEEQMCTQMEQLSISLNQHRFTQQELLEALHLMAWGFRYGLGSGLDLWARIATSQEEWSKGWNDTLS